MKKLVCSAFALSMTSAAGIASESDWSTLDQEVEALTSSLALDNGDGMNMFGRIRTYYQNSGDIVGGVDEDGDDNDLGDFAIVDARLGVQGERGGYGYKLQVDFADNDGGPGIGQVGRLLDAYADFPIGGTVKGRFGQFKGYISRSALVSSGKLAFVDRNAIGNLFATRQEGVAIHGEFEQIDWAVTLQDGSDGAGDDLMAAVRVAVDLIGEGKDLVEGSVGGTEEPSLNAGFAFFDDGAFDDGSGFVIDVHAGTDVYSFGGDMVDIDDDLSTANGTPFQGVTGIALEPDSTPFSVFGTYMLQPGTWELGIRFQDLDNSLDEDKLDIAINNYLDGHNLKWTLQYTTTSSDDNDAEVDVIFLQLQVGF